MATLEVAPRKKKEKMKNVKEMSKESGSATVGGGVCEAQSEEEAWGGGDESLTWGKRICSRGRGWRT